MIFAPATAALRAKAFAPTTPAPSFRAWALSCTSRPALSVNGAQRGVYDARLSVDVRHAARSACIQHATRLRVAAWERSVEALRVAASQPPTLSLDAERQRAAATSIATTH